MKKILVLSVCLTIILLNPIYADITYNSSTNTITLIGNSTKGTESNPFTFEDIYQADQSNGWGVVNKQGDNQYFFNASINIGNGNNTTYFVDSSKQITFADFNDVDIPDINITQNAYFRLGIQESGDITHSGCHISSLATAYSHKIIQSEVPIYIYSSSFDALSDSCYYAFIQINDETNISEFRNCLFRNKVYIYKGYLLLHNVIIENADDGLRSKIADADNVILQKGINGFFFALYSGTSIVRNVKIQNFTYDFRLYLLSTDNVYAIDTECSWNLYWWWWASGKLYRQYSFNLKVVDEEGNPIQNAIVKIYDKNNNIVVDENTDSNGKIPEQIITRGHYENAYGNTLQDYSPHTLIISKDGYKEYTLKFTIDKKTDWTIALQKELQPTKDIYKRNILFPTKHSLSSNKEIIYPIRYFVYS